MEVIIVCLCIFVTIQAIAWRHNAKHFLLKAILGEDNYHEWHYVMYGMDDFCGQSKIDSSLEETKNYEKRAKSFLKNSFIIPIGTKSKIDSILYTIARDRADKEWKQNPYFYF
jgi:hypothetical protein